MNGAWLRGWKMISAYMSCSVKTAKKYYKRYHLTVRRGPGGMPIALKDEVDQWLREFDVRRK